MSRRKTRKTEAAQQTAEDGPRVEPVAPAEAPPEGVRAQPADAPPEAKTEATEAQRTEGQADQADDEDAQDEGPVQTTGLEAAPELVANLQEAEPEQSGNESLPPSQDVMRGKTVEAVLSDLNSGKDSLPPEPEMSQEGGRVAPPPPAQVEAEAQPSTVGPPPDEIVKEPSPPAQAEATAAQRTDAQADQPAEPDAGDEDSDDGDEDEDEDGDLDDEDRGDPSVNPKNEALERAKETLSSLTRGEEERADSETTGSSPKQQPAGEPSAHEGQPAGKEAAPETAAPSAPTVSDPIRAEDREALAVRPTPVVSAPIQAEDRKTLARRLTDEARDDCRSAQYKILRVYSEELYTELGYDSFADYIFYEFGHKRNWGYKQITLVKAADALEAKGVSNPLAKLTPEAATVYRKWQHKPEVFTLAYTQIVGRDEEPTQGRLEAECAVQNDYLLEAERTPGLTPEEYQAYRKLSGLPYTYQLDADFESADQLVEECRRLKKKPPLQAMARVARGADLAALVARLEPLGAEAAEVQDIAKEIDALEKQQRDLSKDRAEIDRKRQELQARIEQKQAEKDELEGVEKKDEDDEEDGPKPKGKRNDGDGDGDQETEVVHRYELKLDGDATAYDDRDDLLDRLKALVESAEGKAKKPGDTATLTLTLTVEAVYPSTDEAAALDAERKVREGRG